MVFEPPNGIDDDIVQLHLEHRVVQRLLGRFLAQGFVHHDLSRACLAHSADAIPRVVLLGRLSLYGKGAVRLHEEVLTLTARWAEAGNRRAPLTPYGPEAEAKTMELLEQSLMPGPGAKVPPAMADKLLASIAQDIADLLPHLESRGQEAKRGAESMLNQRGRLESALRTTEGAYDQCNSTHMPNGCSCLFVAYHRVSTQKQGLPGSVWRKGPDGCCRPFRRHAWHIAAAFNFPAEMDDVFQPSATSIPMAGGEILLLRGLSKDSTRWLISLLMIEEERFESGICLVVPDTSSVDCFCDRIRNNIVRLVSAGNGAAILNRRATPSQPPHDVARL